MNTKKLSTAALIGASLLTVMLGCYAEEPELTATTATASIASIKPSHSVQFSGESGVVGTLDFSGGELKFTGNADESAKVFIKYLKSHVGLIECSK